MTVNTQSVLRRLSNRWSSAPAGVSTFGITARQRMGVTITLSIPTASFKSIFRGEFEVNRNPEKSPAAQTLGRGQRPRNDAPCRPAVANAPQGYPQKLCIVSPRTFCRDSRHDMAPGRCGKTAQAVTRRRLKTGACTSAMLNQTATLKYSDIQATSFCQSSQRCETTSRCEASSMPWETLR